MPHTLSPYFTTVEEDSALSESDGMGGASRRRFTMIFSNSSPNKC